ncbi:MAG: FAD/NAD(P)-binding protein [Desulfobacterales bacterium]|jgi:cation diffusion facilitator CzcD-associated flavoprotein CzcO
MVKLEWLIIGGGIHGTYHANVLVHGAGVKADDLRILDPHEAPLTLWNRHAEACAMRYLRSPSTHNIDGPVLSLYRYARTSPAGNAPHFIPLYNRPSADLFRRHCRHVIQDRGLDRLRLRGRAQALHRLGGHLIVDTDSEPITARRVLLAIGLTEQPRWPGWAQKLRRHGARVDHVFSPGFRRNDQGPRGRTLVVGGGLSAVQTALALLKNSGGPVLLLSRHRLRVVPFDFDPCWIGPKCMRDFVKIAAHKRRQVIDAARKPGTIPEEVMAEVQSVLRRRHNRFSFALDRIKSGSISGGQIRLHTAGGRTIAVERVVLATGFSTRRPGGRFIDGAVERLPLPVGACGYPLVGDDLQWGANLFVTGPLAELRVGPCARNIVGARNAGRLLLAGLKA